MTVFQLKLLAIITMAIDHIGLFFFPEHITWRIIGRLAFPIFAWLIANGARHTHNINAYLKRLLIFALISQIPYWLAFRLIDPTFISPNIFFTLFLGLLAIKIIQGKKQLWLSVVITIICALCAYLMQASYGIVGVLSMVFFYIFFEQKIYLFLSEAIIFLLPLMAASWPVFKPLSPYLMDNFIYQPVCLASLFLIFLYNDQQGLKAKYFFYIFYPAHFFIIYLVKLIAY
ncbi:MAG TPA: TraX family protein [bacterium]|nr:TraX family protein [bacterium]